MAHMVDKTLWCGSHGKELARLLHHGVVPAEAVIALCRKSTLAPLKTCCLRRETVEYPADRCRQTNMEPEKAHRLLTAGTSNCNVLRVPSVKPDTKNLQA